MFARRITNASLKYASCCQICFKTIGSNYGNVINTVTAPFRRFKSDDCRVSIDVAKAMPKRYSEMPNDILLTMAVMGDQDARSERLIREIMAVDGVKWEDAKKTFSRMVTENRRGLFLSTLPYKTGIFTALVAGTSYTFHHSNDTRLPILIHF